MSQQGWPQHFHSHLRWKSTLNDGRPSAARLTEPITSRGASDRKLVSATTIGPAIVTITILSTLFTDNNLHVDNELVPRLVVVAVIEERSLRVQVNLFHTQKFASNYD